MKGAAGLPPHVAVGLQRRIGNRAVARLVAKPARRVLARYESAEHLDLGDRYLADLALFISTEEGIAWAKRYGLEKEAAALARDAGKKLTIKAAGRELTPGQVIALGGDFYASPDSLAAANPQEVDELLGAIGKEASGALAGSDLNAEYQSITLKHRSRDESYLELAKKNEPHFTPGNRREWRRLHEEAVRLARDAKLDQALLYDAFACHFLTDAFAAGHLFDKRTLEVEIRNHLQQHPARPANPELTLYYGLVEAKGATDLLVLKNIHDRLNVEGFDVKNAKGMAWRTYGDTRLKEAHDTQRIAALAVYVSRLQVYKAQSGGQPNADDVLALLPDDDSVRKATERAISYIPAAVADIGGLMYRQRGMAKTELPKLVGPIVSANLATIGAPDRERQILDAQESARKTGLPTPAPQFTVLQW